VAICKLFVTSTSIVLSAKGAFDASGRERQFAEAHAGQRRDGNADRGGNQRRAVFARAGRLIVGGDQP
jgi:hypothetical protein